ncbi:hypothetical protein [Streptomyces sp. DH24]|uniref:hypothetical protein n=1 Tax=Streptomyces sp. DH24 TaxID=3040123 RepID=UPI002442EF47|nr:hypothetical protein [Streptomyces sp. DH24]MDG9715725.1 hypothetical protein [Streptomyces sp. DH24]
MNASRKVVVSALTAAPTGAPTAASSATGDEPAGPAVAVAGDVPREATAVPHGLPTPARTEEQLAADAALLKSAPEGASPKAPWNTGYGTPRTVRAPGGHLTGPQAGEPRATARSRLRAHRALFGLSVADVEALAVRREHELPGTEPYRPGATVASWRADCGTPPAAQGTDAWTTKPPAGRGDGRHVASYTGPESRLGDMRTFFHDSACRPITGDFVTPGQKAVIAPGADYVGLLYRYGADYEFTLTARQTG